MFVFIWYCFIGLLKLLWTNFGSFLFKLSSSMSSIISLPVSISYVLEVKLFASWDGSCYARFYGSFIFSIVSYSLSWYFISSSSPSPHFPLYRNLLSGGTLTTLFIRSICYDMLYSLLLDLLFLAVWMKLNEPVLFLDFVVWGTLCIAIASTSTVLISTWCLSLDKMLKLVPPWSWKWIVIGEDEVSFTFS